MKQAKRVLSLILTMVMCLAMTACSNADDKAFEEADALLAAGDYDGAIAAFSAIGRYQEISAKIAEAEKLRNDANTGFLYGKWFDAGHDIALEFNPDGTGFLSEGNNTYPTTYTYKNNTVTINQPLVYTLTAETQNGFIHLVSLDYGFDFISEADYATAGPVDIEITMDNWQEYFELREINDIEVNSFGDVSQVTPTAGIFLKEEYYSRIPKNYSSADISFELTYDIGQFQALNFQPGEFKHEFAGQYEKNLVREPTEKDSAIITIEDKRQYDWIAEQSPYYNTFSAQCWALMSTSGDGFIYCGINFQVSRVKGTLKLFPE